MRISDWRSDVCSSDNIPRHRGCNRDGGLARQRLFGACREHRPGRLQPDMRVGLERQRRAKLPHPPSLAAGNGEAGIGAAHFNRYYIHIFSRCVPCKIRGAEGRCPPDSGIRPISSRRPCLSSPSSGKERRMATNAVPFALPLPPAGLVVEASLFIDFDGTLVELVERPDAVCIDGELRSLLGALGRALPGRVALVSGRSIAQLDEMLGEIDPTLAYAGSHGSERRGNDGALHLPVRGGLGRARAGGGALVSGRSIAQRDEMLGEIDPTLA